MALFVVSLILFRTRILLQIQKGNIRFITKKSRGDITRENVQLVKPSFPLINKKTQSGKEKIKPMHQQQSNIKKQIYDYLLVLDFEATCDKSETPSPQVRDLIIVCLCTTKKERHCFVLIVFIILTLITFNKIEFILGSAFKIAAFISYIAFLNYLN